MSKAWYVWNEYDGVPAIIFADTASRARKLHGTITANLNWSLTDT